NVTLTGSSLLAGSYSLNVTGTGSPQGVRFIVVALSVVDFNLTASPNPIEVSPGSFVTTAVSVTALNGFSGTVSLTASTPTGLTAVLSPNTITGSGSALVNVTASSGITAGTFAINVTGVSSPLSHVIQVKVTVLPSDFRITAAPSALTARPLENATSTLTISSLNGFAGSVTLSVSENPSTGLSCSVNPTSVTPPAGASATSTLSCSGSGGVYVVTVSGTSSGFSAKTVDVTFTVQDFSLTVNPTSVQVNLP